MQKTSLQLAAVIDDLCLNGYAIYDGFLSSKVITSLANTASQHYAVGEMQEAKIGQNSAITHRTIRGDSTFWLSESDKNIGVKAYFKKMLLLKNALNENLYMNVQEIEAHFAVYPVGSAYKKHLDQFAQGLGTQGRQLSSVLYLNEDWQAANGGALRIYLNEQDNYDVKHQLATHNHSQYVDILPSAGKLVLFLSAQFWHEVLPATAVRTSLTGWFRTRA